MTENEKRMYYNLMRMNHTYHAIRSLRRSDMLTVGAFD